MGKGIELTKLEHALAHAAKGFKVFPIKPGAKAPPLLNGWPEKATTDPATIELWWAATPDANIGIHCEGLVVIDVDPAKGGNESLKLLEITDGLPVTRSHKTGNEGRHLIFKSVRPVANGVDVLGRGLDIRSAGGYVVAPGSRLADGGGYVVENDCDPAALPDWLIERLGTIVPKTGPTAPVDDAPDVLVERAREWLERAERSTKGAGGDQAAYRVACGLRDQGVSYLQACELMRSEAWDYGCGWRGGRLEEKPIASAYRYATGEPGSKAALPSDFPVVQDPSPFTNREQPAKVNVLRLSAFAATAQSKEAGYVVKGLLQRSSYASAYGAPGEGKTFVMLDISYHVAAGAPWHGLKVHAGPVLYLAYEGTGGLVKRAQALRQQYGQADVPLFIAGAAMDLRQAAGRASLGQLLAELPAKPVLIVIDTFARALSGGDENSAQDVSAFNGAVAALIESTGACVCIIHHSGKDKSKGARGSSALLGALDTEIEIDGGQVVARKQRDVEVGQPLGFRLKHVSVGVDSDGEELKSCVVEPARIVADKVGLKGNAELVMGTLVDLSPNGEPVAIVDWRAACDYLGAGVNMSKAFHRAKKQLLDRKLIVAHSDGTATRRLA